MDVCPGARHIRQEKCGFPNRGRRQDRCKELIWEAMPGSPLSKWGSETRKVEIPGRGGAKRAPAGAMAPPLRNLLETVTHTSELPSSGAGQLEDIATSLPGSFLEGCSSGMNSLALMAGQLWCEHLPQPGNWEVQEAGQSGSWKFRKLEVREAGRSGSWETARTVCMTSGWECGWVAWHTGHECSVYHHVV